MTELIATDGHMRTKEWPDPTPEMLASPEFEAIWQCIKSWDVNVPEVYSGYCGANGNHVRAILDALPTPPIQIFHIGGRWQVQCDLIPELNVSSVTLWALLTTLRDRVTLVVEGAISNAQMTRAGLERP